MRITDRVRIQSMILIVIMQFIVDKDRAYHGEGDHQSDGTVDSIVQTCFVITGDSLDDIVGEDEHRNAHT